MAIYISSEEDLRAFVMGSALLGGGGGGDLGLGMEIGRRALERSTVEIRDVSGINADLMVLTTSFVGPQSLGFGGDVGTSMVEAFDMARRFADNIGGLVSSEIGALNSMSPWPASVTRDVPVIDAPCNGRAHPLVVMGSLGLHRLKSYRALITASRASAARPFSAALVGDFWSVIDALRALTKTIGPLATVRNPVKVSYLAQNAAVGAYAQALELGRILLDETSRPVEAAAKISRRLGGRFINDCLVMKINIDTVEGLDVGSSRLRCDEEELEILIANEYMGLRDARGRLLAVFPDLVATIDAHSSAPLLSTGLSKGARVHVIVAGRAGLRLGSGVRYPEAYELLEKILEVPFKSILSDFLVR